MTEDQVLAAYDANMKDLAQKGPSQQDLERVVAKMRSDWYGQLEIPIDRASALSHAVLFDGTFDRVYQIPEDLAKVTPSTGTRLCRKVPGEHESHDHQPRPRGSRQRR